MQPDFLTTTVPAFSHSLLGSFTRRQNAIRSAVDFLQERIREEAAMGDRDAALALAGVLEVMHGLSKATDLLRCRAESDAYDFIASYTDLIAEAGADTFVLQGFSLVADVLRAVDIARKEETQSGQLCSYARVEEIYEGMYAPDRY